ncbi:hypothetical protein DPMN_083422 [Dreissena polymorpha]|uniref:Uncharacterized protein n=1 Tax=Dreissena polymorpha TaxID=45954 RepID=A0A9D4BJU2_DREPO|nr:hypothetical protein DPMN_083422 [Dreissena polymorpha]
MLDNQFQQLHLALRLSVTEGVQQMFQTYITNKEMQVQNTAETIKSSLEDGKTPVMASLKTSPSTSSVGRTRPDRSTTVFYLRGDHMLKLLGASYFKAEMLDNQFQQLHLALRLSVTEGVQQMFQTYITNKEMQVCSKYSRNYQIQSGRRANTSYDIIDDITINIISWKNQT